MCGHYLSHVLSCLLSSASSCSYKCCFDNCLQEEDVPPVGFFELMAWNKQEWYFIVLGCIGSIIVGGSQPAFAVAFSKILAVSLTQYIIA